MGSAVGARKAMPLQLQLSNHVATDIVLAKLERFISAAFEIGRSLTIRLSSVQRLTGSPWLFIPMDGHRAFGNRRQLTMRFDAPALGHAVTAGG